MLILWLEPNFYVPFLSQHLKTQLQIIHGISEDQDTLRGCDFLSGALGWRRPTPRSRGGGPSQRRGVGTPWQPRARPSPADPAVACGVGFSRSQVSPEAGASYLWPRGWAGNAESRSSRLCPILPRLLHSQRRPPRPSSARGAPTGDSSEGPQS